MGRDITCTVPVTFLEAILGGEIQVPTPTGKVIMKIQPLTQSGRVYRLKGMGLAGADLLATMEVVVPKQITAEEVELFRKLHAISSLKNPREEILARLKEENPAAPEQPLPPV
jgi:DnaJ-class molecular chaperone